MLTVKNLRKEYTNTVAIDNISFSLQPGRIFGLLGPNGAGKTTTIRIILNIIKPTTGEVLFDGKPMDRSIQNLTGYLPEERGLYKKSTVLDVIVYLASLKNVPAHKATQLANEWLNKLGIMEYKNKKIEELSKGNQQKIQFITSVIHDPKILILDEPFTGFDPINQQLIKETILSLANAGKIIVLSTHQMDFAEKLCNDIFLINKGKEVCSGNLSEIKRQYGTQSIKIEYQGNAAFLNESKDIAHIDMYQNFAEIQLNDTINPSLFLRSLVDKIDIKHFSIIEPTLNKIFIDTINKS